MGAKLASVENGLNEQLQISIGLLLFGYLSNLINRQQVISWVDNYILKTEIKHIPPIIYDISTASKMHETGFYLLLKDFVPNHLKRNVIELFFSQLYHLRKTDTITGTKAINILHHLYMKILN